MPGPIPASPMTPAMPSPPGNRSTRSTGWYLNTTTTINNNATVAIQPMCRSQLRPDRAPADIQTMPSDDTPRKPNSSATNINSRINASGVENRLAGSLAIIRRMTLESRSETRGFLSAGSGGCLP